MQKSMDRKYRHNSWIAGWHSPSLFACMTLLAVCWCQPEGLEIFSLFIYPIFEFAALLLYLMVSLGAAIVALRAKNQSFGYRFRFVMLNFVVGLIAICFPFQSVHNDWDFNTNLDKRLDVVKLAQADKLKHSAYSERVCILPEHLKYLSKDGGEVIVTHIRSDAKDTAGAQGVDPGSLHVLFFTFRGILSHYSGFEYSSDGRLPEDASSAKQIKLLRPHWYWVAF